MTISDPTAPDTIVLIHGFWVTPRSWEEWISYYQDKGYRSWLGLSRVRGRGRGPQRRPDPDREPDRPAVIDHLTEVIGALQRPPILMGHSAGGVFTQLMLDRGRRGRGRHGLGPTEGVPVVPLSQLKSTFPALRTVGRRKAAGFTFEQWHYAFCNTFPEERSGSCTSATTSRPRCGSCGAARWPPWSPPPGHLRRLRQRPAGAAAVHLRHPRPPHAALGTALQRQALQVQDGHRGGGVRRAAPAALQGRLGRGRRLRPGWAVSHARQANPGKPQTPAHNDNPHHPHRRPDGPYRGGRAADRSGRRPPGRRYSFGWGSSSGS